jgi:mRNA interferase YafQ
MTKYTIKTTTQFKKDYKLAKKRHLDLDLLKEIVTKLANGESLPEKYKDHALSNNWKGHRECHLTPDWLLIYRYDEDVLILTLTRTGSHSDLFGK